MQSNPPSLPPQQLGADNNKVGSIAASRAVSSLSDCVLHHTWLIRSLSAFAHPLEYGAGMQAEMSSFLRGNLIKNSEDDTNSGEILLDDHREQDNGTYVILSWLAHRPNASSCNDKVFLSMERSSKRQRLSDEQHQGYSTESNNTYLQEETGGTTDNSLGDSHLLVDIWVEDEPSAQMLLCYPELVKQPDSNKDRQAIQKCDFCLVRGYRSSYEVIFKCMESVGGCAVGKSLFSPSVAEVTQAMALWTMTPATQQQHGEADGQFDQASSSSSGKPVEFTFALPQAIAKAGLETIALKVPPLALNRLCGAIISHRTDHKQGEEVSPPPKEPDGSQKDTTVTVNGEQLPVNYDDEDGSTGGESLPILRVLQNFFLEHFHINIQTLSLVRGSCSIAVLSCDGRCRVQHPEFLTSILQEIQRMVRNRMGEQLESREDGQHENSK